MISSQVLFKVFMNFWLFPSNLPLLKSNLIIKSAVAILHFLESFVKQRKYILSFKISPEQKKLNKIIPIFNFIIQYTTYYIKHFLIQGFPIKKNMNDHKS